MIKLVNEVFLDNETMAYGRLLIPKPGGRGSRSVHLNTHDMRILAYELLAHAERLDVERLDVERRRKNPKGSN